MRLAGGKLLWRLGHSAEAGEIGERIAPSVGDGQASEQSQTAVTAAAEVSRKTFNGR
jgi:hypothetical protein